MEHRSNGKIDEHTLKILEFDRIVAELSSYCKTVEGRQLLLSQDIIFDENAYEDILGKAEDYRKILLCGIPFPDLDFPPVESYFLELEKENPVLEGKELANIGKYIRSAMKLKKYLVKCIKGELSLQDSSLAFLIGELPDLSHLSSAIFSIVEPDGKIKDSTPELKAIKKKIQNTMDTIRKLAAKYLHSEELRKCWQSDVPTQREGRTVLPLKSESRSRVKGVVHDISSSGATLFIEPLDILEKNNQLVEEQNEYRREVFRILTKLTGEVKKELFLLKELVRVLSFLDTVHARARYTIDHGCKRSEKSVGEIKLIKARHPLLGRKAVPIDLLIDSNADILLISGPNAGGKTVTLKTVGLLVLMNQFGMEIPADEGSKLPFFDGIYADIGDEQSIEQSLSTFSGHMSRINFIIENSTASSLVLLDELGFGTDPEEGSALAIALLDYFSERNTKVIATTHHGAIKNYAISRDRFRSASMEFDLNTLSPTYRVIPEIPGESHALEIAERTGVRDEIIDRARGYLSNCKSGTSELLNSLWKKQKELLLQEDELKKREEKLKEDTRKVDLMKLQLRQRDDEIKRGEISELKRFLDTSRKELENLVRELREGEITRKKTRGVKEFIKSVEERARIEEMSIEKAKDGTEFSEEKNFKPGMEVYIGKAKTRAKLIREEKKGKWLVTTDSLKMVVSREDIMPALVDSDKDVDFEVSPVRIEGKPDYHMDVRGQQLEEALNNVVTQIDRAILSGLYEFCIIHGKGEGVLQRGIHEYLRNNSLVDDYYFSPPEMGGFGKTVVKLKKSN